MLNLCVRFVLFVWVAFVWCVCVLRLCVTFGCCIFFLAGLVFCGVPCFGVSVLMCCIGCIGMSFVVAKVQCQNDKTRFCLETSLHDSFGGGGEAAPGTG